PGSPQGVVRRHGARPGQVPPAPRARRSPDEDGNVGPLISEGGRPSPAPRDSLRQGFFRSSGRIGSVRMRLPVSTDQALQIEGATDGTPGSPRPPGASPESTM